jgi:hypothetical protein
MASLDIHNVTNTEITIKHFDDFSCLNIELETRGKYDNQASYEKVNLYFDSAEQLNNFIYAISMAENQLKEAV